jgi:F-type H+-transporting ATPase subunit a
VIKPVIPLTLMEQDISITNSTLFMFLITSGILLFQWASLKGSPLNPSRLQSLYELSYEFVAKILKESAGKEGLKYFPFIFSIFMFVLWANLLGMLPYSFTITSHIAVTFTLALGVFLFVTTLGFMKHGLKFFHLFYPEGVPLAVTPLVIPIEIIAYLIRPITLGVRLFANMLAGHIVLKLFASFTIAMGVWGFMPFTFIVALTAFEFLIAVLQAYVFTVLSCIYLKDAIHLH